MKERFQLIINTNVSHNSCLYNWSGLLHLFCLIWYEGSRYPDIRSCLPLFLGTSVNIYSMAQIIQWYAMCMSFWKINVYFSIHFVVSLLLVLKCSHISYPDRVFCLCIWKSYPACGKVQYLLWHHYFCERNQHHFHWKLWRREHITIPTHMGK